MRYIWTRALNDAPLDECHKDHRAQQARGSRRCALIERARQRDGAAFWLIMKRHNQQLYRVARAVLEDDTEAEDVVQETYFHAFTHLSEFRAEARLSTWLTRIALNEAVGRRRQRRPTVDIDAIDTMPALLSTNKADPEEATAVARSAGSWSVQSMTYPRPSGLYSSCAMSRG